MEVLSGQHEAPATSERSWRPVPRYRVSTPEMGWRHSIWHQVSLVSRCFSMLLKMLHFPPLGFVFLPPSLHLLLLRYPHPNPSTSFHSVSSPSSLIHCFQHNSALISLSLAPITSWLHFLLFRGLVVLLNNWFWLSQSADKDNSRAIKSSSPVLSSCYFSPPFTL